MIESYTGPTAAYAGSNPRRQSIGLPGHCLDCARSGHVIAHPDLGCGDVGCSLSHDESPAEASGVARTPAPQITIAKPVVPFGPVGVHPDLATAKYYAEAARRIEDSRMFGSNLTASVVGLLREVEATLRQGVDQPRT